MIGSNLAVAFRERSWDVIGSYFSTPVLIEGCQTFRLALDDAQNVQETIASVRPDVIVHSAASVSLSALERDERLVTGNVDATRNTVGAAVKHDCFYALVSSDWVFSGELEVAEAYSEHDERAPINAYGRSKMRSEEIVEQAAATWLISRPANVYGVNLSTPESGGETDSFVWERSSLALRWLARMLKGQLVFAPESTWQCPTSAWSYAGKVCEMVGREVNGIVNAAGPIAMSRYEYMRFLAGAFGVDPDLVRAATTSKFLQSEGEFEELRLPANTVLDDRVLASTVGVTVEPNVGLAEMKSQAVALLGSQFEEVLVAAGQTSMKENK